MPHQRQHRSLVVGQSLRPVLGSLALTMVFLLTVMAQSAPAQTYSVIHNFSGGGDGANPYGGLAIDASGNLYGTTLHGGVGFGGVFKLKRTASGFILNPLYKFTGGSDGAGPTSGVILGPNGTLYGTAHAGGEQNCASFEYPGCGLVFNLRPQATACHSALCPWTETVLHSFTGGSDGANPWGNVIFDHSGNLYGTTQFGGITSCTNGCGTVYKLMPSGGSWTETLLYSFTNGSDGSRPYAGVTFDTTGNLYGTNFWAAGGGCEGQGCGTVYQLTPSGSGWLQNTIYAYQSVIHKSMSVSAATRTADR